MKAKSIVFNVCAFIMAVFVLISTFENVRNVIQSHLSIDAVLGAWSENWLIALVAIVAMVIFDLPKSKQLLKHKILVTAGVLGLVAILGFSGALIFRSLYEHELGAAFVQAGVSITGFMVVLLLMRCLNIYQRSE